MFYLSTTMLFHAPKDTTMDLKGKKYNYVKRKLITFWKHVCFYGVIMYRMVSVDEMARSSALLVSTLGVWTIHVVSSSSLSVRSAAVVSTVIIVRAIVLIPSLIIIAVIASLWLVSTVIEFVVVIVSVFPRTREITVVPISVVLLSSAVVWIAGTVVRPADVRHPLAVFTNGILFTLMVRAISAPFDNYDC